jgi:hypothetical protein
MPRPYQPAVDPGPWTLTYEDPTVTAEGHPAASVSFTV